MIRLNVELGTPEPFRYIGGQDRVVATLKAVVNQEINGNFPGRKPLNFGTDCKRHH